MRRFRIVLAITVVLGVALAGIAPAGERLRTVSISPGLPGIPVAKPEAGMFLVAQRSLTDPHFRRSVVYLVEHDEEGTLGLIVNRPIDTSLAAALPEIESDQARQHTLYFGGPVGTSLIFMLLRSESAASGTAHVDQDVYISTDRRVLDQALAAKKPNNEMRFFVGHSGWAAGQLDGEIRRGGWHVVPADADEIFSLEIDSLWDRLIERLEPSGIAV